MAAPSMMMTQHAALPNARSLVQLGQKIPRFALAQGRSGKGCGCGRATPIDRRSYIRWSSSSSSSGASNSQNGSDLKIYDSLSSSYRALPPNRPKACTIMSSGEKKGKRNNTLPQRGMAWYVCGPTVYDSAHLGHGRTYVSLDILRRVTLNYHSHHTSRPRPLYVMNITDVDDKIIKRSMEKKGGDGNSENGEADPLSLARHYEREFWQDMDALNVMRPDVICRVSEHVESVIVPYIQQIVNGGMAYVIPERTCTNGAERHKNVGTISMNEQQVQGSVYFDVRAFEAITNGQTKYGKLAPDVASTDFFSWESNNNSDIDEGEPTQKKRDPRDFCLWKYRPRSPSNVNNLKPETEPIVIEPSSVSYSSPWGPGRPGWHVECSAMIERLARDFQSTHQFDVHCGGVDLKFPHHSNEIAQAEAFMASADGSRNGNCSIGEGDFKEWIPHWIHTGHLYVKGRKMSKSLKNFVTIREMLGSEQMTSTDTATASGLGQDNNAWSSPADDFRLWVLGLSGEYRGPATFSKARMVEARAIRSKWVQFLMEGQECLNRWNTTAIEDAAYNGDNDDSLRLWGEEELQLFQTVTRSSMNSQTALLDDLDGASFVKELIGIAEAGLVYVRRVRTEERPEEPLRFVLNTFRGQLSLVGFTQRTVNAGISAGQASSSCQNIEFGVDHASSTNTTILDEAVAFRSAIRTVALGAVRKKNDGLDAVKHILKLCDEMRDKTFPKIGIEILDGKVAAETGPSVGTINQGWRHCSPR